MKYFLVESLALVFDLFICFIQLFKATPKAWNAAAAVGHRARALTSRWFLSPGCSCQRLFPLTERSGQDFWMVTNDYFRTKESFLLFVDKHWYVETFFPSMRNRRIQKKIKYSEKLVHFKFFDPRKKSSRKSLTKNKMFNFSDSFVLSLFSSFSQREGCWPWLQLVYRCVLYTLVLNNWTRMPNPNPKPK